METSDGAKEGKEPRGKRGRTRRELDHQEQPGDSGKGKGQVIHQSNVNVNSGKLQCICVNADNLLCKRDELVSIVELYAPDIICVTEFAPKKSATPVQDSELQLEGYNHFSNINSFKRGVIIYVSQKLCMNPVDADLEFDESVWVEVKLKGEDKLLVGCIYRSPNSPENNKCPSNCSSVDDAAKIRFDSI